MKVCFWNRGERVQTEWLWDALQIEERRKERMAEGEVSPFVISVIGAGGKTSTLRRLAWEGRKKGYRVLALTTTHMQKPKSFGVLDESLEQLEKQLEEEKVAVIGHDLGNDRISFCEESYYEKASGMADVVLIEADGSKRLPMKALGTREPVLVSNTNLILCLFGLSALGKAGKDACFRLEIAEDVLGIPKNSELRGGNWEITPERMGMLMKKSYLERIRTEMEERCRGSAEDVIPAFHQADSRQLQETGMDILQFMGEEKGLMTGEYQKETSFGFF